MKSHSELFYCEGEINTAEFIRALHSEPSAYFTPPKLKWEQAPSFYPLRFGADVIRFKSHGNNVQTAQSSWSKLDALGQWLWKSYAAHQTTVISKPSNSGVKKQILVRRVLPSGGACYPNDIYLSFGEDWGPLLSGYIWVYMPQHHALASHSANNLPTIDLDQVSISLVTILSRTAFKYREFAYRLTAVDTGVLLGRLIGTSKEFCSSLYVDLSPQVSQIDIIDPEEILSANVLVNLNTEYDKVESFLDSGPEVLRVETSLRKRHKAISSGQPSIFTDLYPILMRDTEKVSKKKTITEWLKSDEHCEPQTSVEKNIIGNNANTQKRADYSIAMLDQRRSNIDKFTGKACPLLALNSCVENADALVSQLSMLDSSNFTCDVEFMATALNVQSICKGTLSYNRSKSRFHCLQKGNIEQAIQKGMLIQSSDITSSCFIIHVVTRFNWKSKSLNLRQYRNSQMLVGAAIDAISMTAVNLGLSSHTFLGFSAPAVARFYGINTDENAKVTAQICVGYAKSLNILEAPIVR